MTTLHLVTTVYVGGQTGKSTFSLLDFGQFETKTEQVG